MTRTEVKYYADAWFKIEYEINDISIHFKAWKIDSIDEENIENSDIHSKDPEITGFIKWDDCMEFKHEPHYCGLYHAEQTLLLIKHIYGFKGVTL